MLDRRDISRGPTANDRFEGAYTGTGNVPYNWDEDGQHTDTGAFAVIDAKFGDYVSLIAGGRADSYKVSVYGTDVNGVYGKAADKNTAYSYNLSANYTMMEDINLYGTYATLRLYRARPGRHRRAREYRREELDPELEAEGGRAEGLRPTTAASISTSPTTARTRAPSTPYRAGSTL